MVSRDGCNGMVDLRAVSANNCDIFYRHLSSLPRLGLREVKRNRKERGAWPRSTVRVGPRNKQV
jgi:predicted sulfurtransferase